MEKKEKKSWGERAFNAAIVLFFIIIAAAVIVAGWRMYKETKEVMEEGNKITTQTVQIQSVDYSSGVSGHFYLGYGYVSSNEYYACYQVLDDGGKKLLKLDANCTIIYDTLPENEMAYAEIDSNGWGSIKEIRLYVPKNVIKVGYDFGID